MSILWGIAGIIVLLGIAILLSSNRKAINPRTVLSALLLQLLFAFIVLKWDWGKHTLKFIASGVQKVLDSANAGSQFLFGGILEVKGIGFIFAFQVLPVIIFFASLVSILYYFGVMQWIISMVGGFISKVLRTSKTESMSVAGSIFLGQNEAPLLVRPYIAGMTQSELFAIMTGGLACVAGSNLAAYAAFGVPLTYLLAASVMGAPAGLLMAKLIMPETEKREANNQIELTTEHESKNVLDAAAHGAMEGLRLALGVGAMLIAFISLISLINLVLHGVGSVFSYTQLSLEGILGILFAPVAFIMGIPWEEAVQVGTFLGQKFVVNEMVAYSSFGPHIAALSDKTVAIISFALCGFANFGSIAIWIGMIEGLAPKRRSDVARFGVKAVLAATLANLLNGIVAGIFIL
ncbi:concentrative nucleoside transporter, CNT family [Seinonella peptonophila]|uniref:Nucleoside permease n=1 Tax=Seinonella peptonophila TaxID=112248 RepID=A0A1M4ZPR1_9BACL|nr:NupC/NupG family nucleoside CNT transporter [Seinonella peptonophila]SHF20033.1 concentrative nucleoside transporter, CNT family [Seinonella peptonophila]